MIYFDGYDIDGNRCRIQEFGNEIGFVTSYSGGYQAVRLAASVYMATNGRVYASTIQNCSTYATKQWHDWARRKMLAVGFSPKF